MTNHRPNTYTLRTIGDLLTVPSERLSACLRDIEYGIELTRLAYGTKAEPEHMAELVWTDDGEDVIRLSDPDGEVLALEINKNNNKEPT